MLKTLRITSLVAVIIAACGVAVMVILGLRGDSDIKAYLEKPSISEKYKGQAGKAANKTDEIHPLVAQAKKFALRINPPPPPPPPKPKADPKAPPPPDLVRNPAPPPRPQVVHAAFEVLATVRYESDPSKSLTLLKSGNTIEWFRQGDKAAHLDIDEVCDGSVVFSQNGKNKQTLYVPAKDGKSLLKNDQTAIASAQQSQPAGLQIPQPMPMQAAAAVAVDTGTEYTVQTAEQTLPAHPTRADLSSRIQRIRAVPPEPTPQQQKAEVESAITGIEDIINRQDGSSEMDREAENKIWMELLDTLKSEKESLESQKAAEKTQSPDNTTAQQDASQNEAEGSQPPSEQPVSEQPVSEQPVSEQRPSEQAPAQETVGEGEPESAPAADNQSQTDSQTQNAPEAQTRAEAEESAEGNQAPPEDEGPAPEAVNEY